MATVFRADHVGSLVVPEELARARADQAAGIISTAQLRAAEDAAITTALAVQQEAGLAVFTDGCLRRPDPYAMFASAIEGIEPGPPQPGALDWSEVGRSYSVARALRQRTRLVLGEVEYLRRQVPGLFKASLLGPASLACALFRGSATGRHYAGIGELAAAFAPILRGEIEALAVDTVPYIQLNCPAYARLLEPAYRTELEASGENPELLLRDLIACDVAALQGVRRTAGVIIAVRVGLARRSQRPPEGYGALLEWVFKSMPADRFLIEFEQPREEDFAPLRALPKGNTAVLGLIGNDSADLGGIDGILDSIDLAAKFTDAASLAISPQRGFAAPGQRGSPELMARQRTALQLTGEVARRYWGVEL